MQQTKGIFFAALFILVSAAFQRAFAQTDSIVTLKDTIKPLLKGASPNVIPVGGCPAISGVYAYANVSSTVCPGTSVTFTANVTIAGGGVAHYIWFMNGKAVGSDSKTFTTTVTGTTSVYCSASTEKPPCQESVGQSNTVTVPVYTLPVLTPISGSSTVCAGSAATYSTSSGDAAYYNWIVEPSSAGTITLLGNGASMSISFASGFAGTATLVTTGTVCSLVSTGQSMNVAVPGPIGAASPPVGPSPVCQGNTAIYTTSAPYATSYNWSLNGAPVGGTGASNTINLPQGLTGNATITVSGNGCGGTGSSASGTVTITPSVSAATAPSGTTQLCQGSAPSIYTTETAGNATGYAWSVSPSSAGTISGSGTSATVNWNSTFSGAAQVAVQATCCNESATPRTTAIAVQATVGAPSAPSGPAVIDNNGGTSTYTSTAANAIGYTWGVSPAEAGGTTGTGSSAVFTWNPLYSGNAILNVSASANGCNGPSAASTAVSIYLPLNGGSVTPALPTLPSGSDPGVLTASLPTCGNCNGAYKYQWQQSSDGSNFQPVAANSTGESCDPGILSTTTYFRRQVVCGTDIAYTNIELIPIGTPPSLNSLNYTRIRTITKAGITDTVTADGLTSPYDVQQTTQYFDALGRPMQTVAKQASPLQMDMVSMQVYDGFGRQPISYLPYTSPSNDGNYKSDPFSEQNNFYSGIYPGEQYYYSETNYEASNLERVTGTSAPGSSWVGSGRGVGTMYLMNAVSDSVRLWNINSAQKSIPFNSGTYQPGRLYKMVEVDEQGNQVVQYTDELGKTILKKVQLSPVVSTGPSGWANTYYVYDTLQRLRYIIPPQAVVLIQGTWSISAAIDSNLCFRYEYDQRNLLIVKKTPGAGETWAVYDARKRLVMMADANLRGQGQWLVRQYDSQDRPDTTGIITDHQNLSYEQNLAISSINYPNIAAYPYVIEAVTHYDDYSWVPSGLSPALTATYTNNNTYFVTSYNTSPTYAVPIVAFPITRGQVTGTTQYLLSSTTTQALNTVAFYDDRNRVIQTENQNISTGVDIGTTQYGFSGEPLRSLLVHQKNGSSPQQHIVLTAYNYDAGLRLKSIYKNIDGAAGNQLIDSMQYNELGQLRAKYLGNNLDSLIYDYNVRGWLTGINKKYVAGTANNYFGMELAYDKQTSVSTTSYAAARYNGALAGVIWKSAGDGINRKYDFTYDNINRLTAANFLQNPSGMTWNTAAMNYTVDSLSYDANGNILTMNQYGFKVGSPGALIDQLTYSYQNTNQLSQVMDGANDTASTLGDFHYHQVTKLPSTVDYAYDGDGNLKFDNNKGIDSIAYNYLSLPVYVHMKGKGTIIYTYDANGTRWKKTITDSLAGRSITIVYIGGFVYQQVDTITNPAGGIDTLQFMTHEEGRVRWAFHQYTTGASAYGFEYDFYEKDHQGNTRILLTQEKDTAKYMATMEAAYRSTEDQLFYNIPATSYARASVPQYPVDTTVTNPNDSVARVNGGGQKVGPAIILKVMSGDIVDISTNYYYNNYSGTGGQKLGVSDLLNALAGGLVSLKGASGETLTALTSGTSPLPAALTSFLTGNDTGTAANKPSAYLNWMLLDNQFNLVSSYPQTGALQVGASGVQTNGTLQSPLAQKGIPISTSGYLYIYVSNATPTDVFFDNLSIVHYSGPLVEENHYYPFGLGMAGISDKAIKPKYTENKYRYNDGTELQHGEFSDGTGLELYETSFRSLDPQLGRFSQIDPLADQDVGISCYAYVGNNPVLLNDPSGLRRLPLVAAQFYPKSGPMNWHLPGGGGDGIEAAAWSAVQSDAQQWAQDYANGNSSDAPGVSLQDILASTPKAGAAILTADGTGAFNLIYANEASASFGTKNGEQGTWINYGYGLNDGSGGNLSTDVFVSEFIEGDYGPPPGLKDFIAIASGEAAGDRLAARAIASTMINRIDAANSSLWDPNWMKASIHIKGIGGTVKGNYQILQHPKQYEYNMVMSMTIDQIMKSNLPYIQGALQAYNAWGVTDYSNGAISWSATPSSPAAMARDNNFKQVAAGVYEVTTVAGNSTFFGFK
jgi:RHS repeat-associated protein